MDQNIMECFKWVFVELDQSSHSKAGHAATDICICQRTSACYASTLCDRKARTFLSLSLCIGLGKL